MCGITGIIGTLPERASLEGAMRSLVHRGPDSSGMHWEDGAALAHTRLGIIDLTECGHQPMRDHATGVVIVYNGEIYNYRELRETLTGHQFRGHSDTEVALGLFLEEGIGFIEKLRGMFAIAIWDPRDRTLYLARDRFGIKPLYYRRNKETFSFASEIKALLKLGTPAKLNKKTAYDYLAFGRMAHDEATFFDGIKALDPGTVMTLRGGVATIESYWSADRVTQERQAPEDTEEAVWELLKDSLRHHLISDVPIGLNLSSGLDSQLIAHLLAAIGEDGFHAFTFGYRDKAYDEIGRLDKTSFPVGFHRHNQITEPEDVLASLERAMDFFETPLGGLGTLSAFRLMELPGQSDIKVVLSGEGSDEIFAGYRYYHESYLLDLIEGDDQELLGRELDAYKRLYGSKPDLVQTQGIMRAPDGTSLEGAAFLGPALKGFAAGNDGGSGGKAGGHLRSAMLKDLQCQKLPKLLHYQDRAAMAHGVEVRVPFLDHKILEYVWRLPPDWLIRDGVSKFLPKRLLKRFCGVDYMEQTKHFVATPQREWIKGPLLASIMAYLDGGALAGSGLIDFAAFRKAYLDYAADSALGNSFFVWKVLNMEVLLRRWFAGAA